MVKVHIGCGSRDFGEDWIHIDGGDFQHIDYKDVTKLSFKNDSVDLIYASHLIAYFDRDEIVWVLNEWKRVLKIGGKLRIATPDFNIMIRLYDRGHIDLNNLLGPLYGKMSMKDKRIYHKTTYDFNDLHNTLIECGFRSVERYDWRDTEHAHIDDCSQAYMAPDRDKESGTLISLNVECLK